MNHWASSPPNSDDKIPLSGPKGPDERLPMLIKQFRVGTGDYGDFCELQEMKVCPDTGGTYAKFPVNSLGGTVGQQQGVAPLPACPRTSATSPAGCGKPLRTSADAKVRTANQDTGTAPYYLDVSASDIYNTTDYGQANPDILQPGSGQNDLSCLSTKRCQSKESNYGCPHSADAALG